MASRNDVARLAALMRGARTLVLTGAGVSTDAGIPDHRGVGSPTRRTVEYGDFVLHEMWQRWVWWRSELSWQILERTRPTTAHRALAALEGAGDVVGVTTQNVDRLHSAAGSRNVAELHGRYDAVVCLHCDRRFPRSDVSTLIRDHNPGREFPPLPPDHVEVLAARDRGAAAACSLVVPACPSCGGLLKPDVVFFGEPIPEAAVRHALALANECDVVLAVGTSLAVSTGMWVLMQARESGARLAIVNRGPTEADRLADLRLEGGAGEVLGGVAEILLGEGG